MMYEVMGNMLDKLYKLEYLLKRNERKSSVIAFVLGAYIAASEIERRTTNRKIDKLAKELEEYQKMERK